MLERTTETLTAVQRAYLPRKRDQAKTVSAKKRKLLGLPPAPIDYRFNIPDNLRTFANGDLFLLHDSGSDDEKVVLRRTKQML